MKYASWIAAPLFYLLVAFAGGRFTAQGLGPWYQSLSKPAFTPPGNVIGGVWTIIYILSALSLILFVESGRGRRRFAAVLILYATNGVLNALWSFIFFTRHLLGLAVVDALLIWVTVALLVGATLRVSLWSALLLLPYLVWVSFATYLSYAIYRLN